MIGNTYLSIALTVAGTALALRIIGPLAHRWHKKLERDLERMKQGDSGTK